MRKHVAGDVERCCPLLMFGAELLYDEVGEGRHGVRVTLVNLIGHPVDTGRECSQPVGCGRVQLGIGAVPVKVLAVHGEGSGSSSERSDDQQPLCGRAESHGGCRYASGGTEQRRNLGPGDADDT